MYFYVLIDTGVFPMFPDERSQSSFQIGVLVAFVNGLEAVQFPERTFSDLLAPS